MLRRTVYHVANKLNVRMFSTKSAINHGEYSVGEADTLDEYMEITKLRVGELWRNDPNQKEIDVREKNALLQVEFNELVAQTQSGDLSCIIAVKNQDSQNKKDDGTIYGGVDLMLNMNASEDIFAGREDVVDPKWIPQVDTDAYINNLVVAPDFRRRSVASNLLDYAKSKAVETGKKRVFVHCDEKNAPVIQLNVKKGFELVSRDHDALGLELMMGMHI